MSRNKKWALFAALLLVASGVSTGQATASPGTVVRTDSGPVKGVAHDGYRTFQGIPFAAPPVGELRWQPPRAPKSWTEPRDATEPGSQCPQAAGLGSPAGGDEDCLFLNVTTPEGHGSRPVMVWVHGGGFTSGSGSMYDAHRLAVQGDVVVVTVNYRLGVLGFYGHPELNRDSGAFGLQDQVAALKWVRRNAAAFGGDPRNVTLFGESAGGMSTCGLLTSPGAAGLFHRAIVQSGPCTITWPVGGQSGSLWSARADVEARGGQFAASRGCPDVACLRRVPAADLIADPLTALFNSPAYDTRVLPENPADAVAKGHFQRIPVLAGTTRDESSLFVALQPPHPVTEERYQDVLRAAFGPKADVVAARYPSSAYGTPGNAWAAMETDRVWACSALTTDRLLAAGTRLFAYEFADRDAPLLLPFPPDVEPGAYHASELVYLFDVAGFDPRFTPAQRRLSEQMVRSWTRFAETGSPGPGWQRFPTVRSLAPDAVKPVDLGAEHQCAFWASIG